MIRTATSRACNVMGNGLIDDLTYTYSGNQLTRMDDATDNAAGFSNVQARQMSIPTTIMEI